MNYVGACFVFLFVYGFCNLVVEYFHVSLCFAFGVFIGILCERGLFIGTDKHCHIKLFWAWNFFRFLFVQSCGVMCRSTFA